MARLGTRAFSVVVGVAALAAVPGAALAADPVNVAVVETPADPTLYDAVSSEPNRPRPLPVETETPPRVPTERRLDIGVGPAFVARFASSEAGNDPSGVTYLPTLGLEVHVRIPIVESVEVSPYLVVASHAVDLPDGSLGVNGSIESGSVTAMCFGARVARTFQVVEAVRVWGSAGVGYGRMEFGRMIAQEGGRPAWEIRDRGASFVEFPFGLGGSYTVVPRWLSVDLEGSAGPVLDKQGTAFATTRAIDDSGLVRRVGALPEIEATMVIALGLSLIL
jgi:hypothetical protein